MNKRSLILVLLCSVAALGQQSPTTAPAPSERPATREDIVQMMDALQLRKQMESMQQTMVAQIKPMLDKMAHDQLKNITPEQREKFNQIIQDSVEDGVKAYPVSEMIADAIPIYQKYMTKGDVQAITAFYTSPTGRKLLDKQPDIMRDFLAVVMPKMQERVQASAQKMQARIRDVMAEGGSTPAGEPKEKEFTPATPAAPQK